MPDDTKLTIQDLHASGYFTVVCPRHNQPITAPKVSTGCPQCVAERMTQSLAAFERDREAREARQEKKCPECALSCRLEAAVPTIQTCETCGGGASNYVRWSDGAEGPITCTRCFAGLQIHHADHEG